MLSILRLTFLKKFFQDKKKLFLLVIFLLGCQPTEHKNIFQTMQWSLYYNAKFYETHKINTEAHIHHKKDYYKYTGKDIKIVIIDDGLDVNHEELNKVIIKTWDLTTKTSNVEHTYQMDYHGTAVTGIISAQDNTKGIRGLAPNSKIYFLKHKPNMTSSEILELLHKANSYNPDIINCSWGTYNVSKSVKNKIQTMAREGRKGKGIVFVWASGNNEQDIENDESAIKEVIAVGSTNKNNKLSYLNNYGEELDILAPGGDFQLGITTLDPMSTNGIGSIEDNYILPYDDIAFDGTSASAPIVTAIVAIMLELNSNLTNNEVYNILTKNTDKIGDEEYINGHNIFYGYGKINLSKIIDYIRKEERE